MSTGTGAVPAPRKRLSADERREVIELAARAVFAERGYHGASMGEIARRSGVTPPVVYDHFSSKVALHRRLLERTRDELLEMWSESIDSALPPDERVAAALDAWARYVEAHPYAPRMFFVETTGDPEIAAIHAEVRDQASSALATAVARASGVAGPPPGADPLDLQMATEIIRSGLTGLAVWWSDHPEVPREQIVAAAVNAIWIGLERVQRGDAWRPAV